MSYNKEFLEELREERNSYRKMVQFCCDNMILNNDIINELSKSDFYFDIFCGCDRYFTNAEGDYISEEEFYKLQEEGKDGEEFYYEFYQYFIINYEDAERLAEYTNEVVFYNEQLDLYLLAVTHCGTRWDYVPANWKELDEVGEDD